MSSQPQELAPSGATPVSSNAGVVLPPRAPSRRTRANSARNRVSKAESSDTGVLKEEIDQEGEDKITGLARDLSRVSMENSRGINTFLDPTSRADLDPNSERFSARRWLKNTLDVSSRDPDSYPRRSAGVSFRNLNVFGYGTAVDYQTTVGNMWLKGFGWLQRLFGSEKKIRIDILRNFEGFVRSGEMIVVLGRPGRLVLSPQNKLYILVQSH